MAHLLIVGCQKSPEDDGIQVPETWEIFSVQDLITDEHKKMYSNTLNRTVIHWGFHEKDRDFWSSPMKISADASLTPLKFLGGGRYNCWEEPDYWDINPKGFDGAGTVIVRLPNTEETSEFALICETESGKVFRSPVYRITVRAYTKEELGMENTSEWKLAEVKIEKVEE